MSILSLLYDLLIGPLQLLFEFVFSISYKLVGNPGICIIDLSLIMNLLALPLYRRADAMQKEEKEKEASLEKGISHIRETFKGDERFLILQTYYRQNSHSPVHVLRGSVSLFLQIPFFMAAYRMLSSLSLLSGEGFGPIKDLGAPDGLLVIGAVSINLLPILMTAINLVSSCIYLKGSSLKEKIQLFAVAGIFLVLLYNSPAGLVFYWTCNNIFSLMKNILLPKREKRAEKASAGDPASTVIFVLCGIYCSLFIGFLIPSNTVSSSPSDFIDMFFYTDPVNYLAYSLALAFGTFIVWAGVFYYLSKGKARRIMVMTILALSVLFTVDYSVIKADHGALTRALRYTAPDLDPTRYLPESICLLLIISTVLYFVRKYAWRYVRYLCIAGVIIVSVSGFYNIHKIHEQLKGYTYLSDQLAYAQIDLDPDGKNVVVIMLDRAVGYMVPYIFGELPGLEEQFDGFTYYPNTVSFGAHTNIAAPALFGGYDYIPEMMNERSDELLVEKHDEALKVLPFLFSDNGFDVTVCDPSYAGYMSIPDLSIYDGHPDIDTYITHGRFNPMKEDMVEQMSDLYERNMFCYSLFRAAPLFLQGLLYDNGFYNYPDHLNDQTYTAVMSFDGQKMIGYDTEFMDSFTVLDELPEITETDVSGSGSFTILVNYTPHALAILDEPSYLPEYRVDNTEYDQAHPDRFTTGGEELEMSNYLQYALYNTNAAAYVQLGEWFDYLRDQDLYDNTRIIVVSDHGYDLGLLESRNDEDFSTEWFSPVLLVKDFDSHGFTVSDEFMTNADTAYLATKDLVEDPVNPFTGNPIDTAYKDDGEVTVFASHEYMINENNGNTFIPGPWYSVSGDMRDMDNWEYEGQW